MPKNELLDVRNATIEDIDAIIELVAKVYKELGTYKKK
jgi:N-acetylglutamate synthase-like GNAT family acetyltransferase